MTKLEAIATAKTFRKEADELLQRMKAHKLALTSKPCLAGEEPIDVNDIGEVIAQHTLSIHDLENAIMRQGMALKYIGNPSVEPVSSETLAKAAYSRYGSVTDFKNFRGDPMPAWEDLGEKIQSAWIAAISTHPQGTPPSTPYPNSYNPESPVVDPTADGLKL